MDRTAIAERIMSYMKQYRYVLLIFLLGMVLMLLPSPESTEAAVDNTEIIDIETSCEEKLSDILSQIDGVGKTEVLLTMAAGEQVIYHCDDDESAGNESTTYRRETVIVSDSDRNEQGLIAQIIPPKYQGAIVVCQGADKASIKLCIVEAVTNVTGLTADRITVLKMK